MREVEASAGILYSSRAHRWREVEPSHTIMSPSLRELTVHSEVYDVRYFIKLSANGDSLTIQPHGFGRLISTDILHPFLLNVRVLGRNFEDLEVVVKSPWRLCAETIFTMNDGKAHGEISLKIPLLSAGSEDQKHTRVKFPRGEDLNLKAFDFKSAFCPR